MQWHQNIQKLKHDSNDKFASDNFLQNRVEYQKSQSQWWYQWNNDWDIVSVTPQCQWYEEYSQMRKKMSLKMIK